MDPSDSIDSWTFWIVQSFDRGRIVLPWGEETNSTGSELAKDGGGFL
jgi:hypothetical protein